MKNLEIKVAYKDHKDLINRLKELGAHHIKVMQQVDTYFSVPTGRMNYPAAS